MSNPTMQQSILNSSDLVVLKRFKEKADVLCDEKYSVLDQLEVSISANTSGFEKVSTEFPNDDLVKCFLMDVRIFILKDNNNFNFEKVCQFFIESDYEKQSAVKWLDAYKKLLDQETMRLQVGQKELTTRMVFYTILNEEHFHQEMDQKGMSVIKSSPIIEPMARMKFFDVLGKLRLIICAFNKQIVEKYLQENEK